MGLIEVKKESVTGEKACPKCGTMMPRSYGVINSGMFSGYSWHCTKCDKYYRENLIGGSVQ